MPSPAENDQSLSSWVLQARQLLATAFLVMLLVACQPSKLSATPPQFNPSNLITLQPTVGTTIPNTPAARSTLVPQLSPSPIFSPTSITTMVTGSLDFGDPTQGTDSVSTWRPPLYDIPWAPTLYDHFFFASPIAANEINTPVADYRYGGVFFQDVVHTGVDIPASKGTPVLAAGPGTVVWAGYGVYRGGYDESDPYGLAVTIRHDFGYQNQTLYTIYGHLDQIDVVEGQHVDTGDRLGLVGETGKVTGPHLHFEIRLGENSYFTTRNPELWLVPPIGWGIIAGRVMDTYEQLINDQMIIITDPEIEKNWFAWSYGKTSVNSDTYYQENLVVGDMPAGTYLLRIAYGGVNFTGQIEVQPGMVNYFTFRGFDGIFIEEPLPAGADFTPASPGIPAP